MARAVHREPAVFTIDYVNLRDSSVGLHANKGNEKHAAPDPWRNIFRLVCVGFGLLCILQAALNVSLRLKLFKFDTQPETVCRNGTDKQRPLIEQHIQKGWVYFHTSLYYISSTKKTWKESREFCLQQDADLVVINTKEEQDFTRQFHRFTWLGLQNVGMRGRWTWVDGTPLTEGFSYWGPGEPNGFEGKNENCVEIRFFDLENSWNDIPCEDENFWICEKEAAL